MPVVRQEDRAGEIGIECTSRRERRRLGEQGDRLGHDHRGDPGRHEPPQPRGHPAGHRRGKGDAEPEREAEQRQPPGERLQSDADTVSAGDRRPRFLADAEQEGAAGWVGVGADNEPFDDVGPALARIDRPGQSAACVAGRPGRHVPTGRSRYLDPVVYRVDPFCEPQFDRSRRLGEHLTGAGRRGGEARVRLGQGGERQGDGRSDQNRGGPAHARRKVGVDAAACYTGTSAGRARGIGTCVRGRAIRITSPEAMSERRPPVTNAV